MSKKQEQTVAEKIQAGIIKVSIPGVTVEGAVDTEYAAIQDYLNTLGLRVSSWQFVGTVNKKVITGPTWSPSRAGRTEVISL